MSDDEIEITGMSLMDPGRIPVPDRSEVGKVTCRCGGRTIGPVTGTIPGASMIVLCTNCGEWIESKAAPESKGAHRGCAPGCWHQKEEGAS